MKLLKAPMLILLSVYFISCSGDYRRQARGGFGEVVVVMDSTRWDSRTADAIRSVYGGGIETLPTPESRFDLTFRDFSSNEELEQIKFNKNIIIAANISEESNVGDFVRSLLGDPVEERVEAGEAFAFDFEDQWYRNQWTIILTSTDDSTLAARIRNSEDNLVQSLMKKEMARWRYEIYEKGEQVAMEDSLWKNKGWKIRIQHDYNENVDTTYVANGDSAHFLTMRRYLPDNDRWFWAWWKDDVSNIDFLDNNWINAKRDSLMEKWVRGTRDSSYVTTEYRRPVNTRTFELNGDLAYETLGTWRMTHDAMGGPFANLTIYNDETQRLFMLEFGQFAPKYNKRRFIRQFRTMLRTFQSDSTWNQNEAVATN